MLKLLYLEPHQSQWRSSPIAVAPARVAANLRRMVNAATKSCAAFCSSFRTQFQRRGARPVLADCVAKLFSAPRRERSIQDRAPSRNIDSKARAAGFDYFKFQFHRLGLATLQQNRSRRGL